MKKITSVFLVAVLVMTILAMPVFAENNYTQDDD